MGHTWPCHPHQLVTAREIRSRGLTPGPPQPLTREELPLLGQRAGIAFPPGEMPTQEFALHSLTPALIIGIKLASLFPKSRELISCSPFSARGSGATRSLWIRAEGGGLCQSPPQGPGHRLPARKLSAATSQDDLQKSQPQFLAVIKTSRR